MIVSAAQEGAPGVARPVYTVRVERDGKWWVFHIDEIDATGQSSSLAGVEAEAVGIIAAWDEVEIPVDSINVLVEVLGVDDEYADWVKAEEAEGIARAEQIAAAQRKRAVVAKLKAEGWTQADIATALGVSKQRVSQLSSAPAASASQASGRSVLRVAGSGRFVVRGARGRSLAKRLDIALGV